MTKVSKIIRHLNISLCTSRSSIDSLAIWRSNQSLDDSYIIIYLFYKIDFALYFSKISNMLLESRLSHDLCSTVSNDLTLCYYVWRIQSRFSFIPQWYKQVLRSLHMTRGCCIQWHRYGTFPLWQKVLFDGNAKRLLDLDYTKSEYIFSSKMSIKIF